jgi:hypothetical protein
VETIAPAFTTGITVGVKAAQQAETMSATVG